MNPSELEHRRVATNGLELHVVSAGPKDGPLVVLLHGFPEFWYGWRNQIGALADAGFRVLVPDQRGYNLSDKPKSVRAYGLDELAKDIVGLIDAEARDTATVVGHDWGAAVAWWLALEHPSRISRAAVLNVPHPEVFKRYLVRTPRQWFRSWYMLFFQLPLLPELAFTTGGGKPLARSLRRTGRQDTFSDADLELYREAWLRPGAARGMIHWYRAGLRAPPEVPDSIRIRVPLMIIWGRRDVALSPELATLSHEVCDDARLEIIDDATHWVQHDAPERVNRLLLEHLKAD